MLSEFIESDEELSWIAVNGSGGAGKSKLLYYFVKEMRINPKWKSVWIHAENCEQFARFAEWRYPCNLLVVIDYAGTAALIWESGWNVLSGVHIIRIRCVLFLLNGKE